MPRTSDQRPRCQREQLRTTLSSALQDFGEKSNVLVKAIPKQPPEGDVSEIGPTWRYGAKLVERKIRSLRIKCTCQRHDHINEKGRLDGVTSIIATNRK